MKPAARVLVASSGFLFLVTAFFHGSGVEQLGVALADSSLPSSVAEPLRGLWLFFSWHLIILAAAAFLSAASGQHWLRPVLFFCGLVAMGDFFWVLRSAGWFLGTALLLSAAIGLLVGGWFWRIDKKREETSNG